MLRFTAKVKKREVVVRGVDLPDGSTVDVTIDPHEEEDFVLTPEDLAGIDESIREIRRGEFVTGDELLATLRERRAVPRAPLEGGATRRAARTRAVGAARNGAKSSRGRSR